MHPMTKENRKLGKQTNSCPKCCQWKVVMVHLLPSCLLLTPPALSGTLVEYKKDKLHSIHNFVNFGETCCEEAATLLEHLVFE